MQITQHSHGKYNLGEPEQGQMPGHHGGNGNLQRIWAIKRLSGCIRKQHWLNAKFHSRAQGREIDPHISADAGSRRRPPSR